MSVPATQRIIPSSDLDPAEAMRRHARELVKALFSEREARQRAESELRKLVRLVDQIPAMAMLLDPQGRIRTVNPRVSAVTGFRSADLLGQPLDFLATPASRRELYPRLWGAVRTGREWHGELEHRLSCDEPIWVTLSLSPLTEPDGTPGGYVAILQDVSDSKQAEQTLRKANSELKKVSDLKSAFVSTVSHELRTPLTAIRNALDILATGAEGEDRERFLHVAARNVHRLTDLVNDLLDLNRVETGRLAFHFVEADPRSLVDEVASTFEAQAAAAGVVFGCHVPTALPAVWADPARVSQALGNLVSNAIKFTAAGGRVILEARGAGELVELAVRDSGVGMTPEQLARVFDPFYQVEEAAGALRERELKGSGLGLAIARNLVLAHGGRLTATSEPGRGSRFALTLPLAGPSAREMTNMEEEFQGFREHPFFGVISVPLPASCESADPELRAERLAALATALRGRLPRPSDRILVQPARGRIVIVLLGTDKAGCQVVTDRLGRGLAAEPAAVPGSDGVIPRLLGPAVYPDDGTSGRELLDAAEGRTASARTEQGER